ncbi:MAG TPA: TadE family protein [Stellaceae bacterium]|nr:TadE family protein [Stellaceae bacterium]
MMKSTRFPLKTHLRRALLERCGAAAVEFALTVPILLLVMLGIIEFGRILWAQNALHYAVEQAARCRTIDVTTCDNTADTQSYASTVSAFTFPTSVFTVTTPVCGNQVSASYAFQFMTGLFGTGPTLTAQACFPT